MIYDRFGKRIMDIFGSIFGIILFFPFMLATAIWIKLASPEGPIFADIPERVGKGGRRFKMFKFRSMIPNAHEWLLKHPEWYEKYKANDYKLSEDEDPRFIKGAKFIRKTSLDEFPQFFNILFGDMSLVGPRAYYPFEIEEQTEKFPETKEYISGVLLTKPGLTGPWQVGGRSEISFSDRVKMDAEYAKKKSLLYDLTMMLKTPYAVLTAKGAY